MLDTIDGEKFSLFLLFGDGGGGGMVDDKCMKKTRLATKQTQWQKGSQSLQLCL